MVHNGQNNDDVFALACSALIPILPRLVERPWGGMGLPAYKGVEDSPKGARYGEAFEVSAWDEDPETAALPSVVLLPDGSNCPLTMLLDKRGEAILGKRLNAAHGSRIPLLPKVLCVKELLSVQAHPPQRPEVYIVLDAEPGATLRLGWKRDVDAHDLGAKLEKGRELQERLLRLVSPKLNEAELGRLVSQRLGSGIEVRELCNDLLSAFGETGREAEIEVGVGGLRELYWQMLGLLSEVPVRKGQVIYNAATRGDLLFPDAEVHALGNPQGRELLCLEVRLPGTTYRAWDNCRFPMRPVHVAQALSSMPLVARKPESFLVEPQPLPGYPGVSRCVENGLFVVDRIEVEGVPRLVPNGFRLRTLHGVAGHVLVRGQDGKLMGELRAGQCALSPASLGELVFEGARASVIQISLPA
ncbi:MAG: hypothetical protein MUC50_13680 [Myxococcota bacterium]|jgi:hypothetical protein|nr:hypothetical protein [Myxococcota bacterium]